ncbi:unnamed protein product, partial [Notodromas monacha]
MAEAASSSTPAAEAGALIASWEESGRTEDFNLIAFLHSVAEVVEREYNMYLRQDPDPFDDRHPARADPNCNFGAVLKAIFKKEHFYSKLTREYTRDNFYPNSERSAELNTAACRVLLSLMPGLEPPVVFTDADVLISRLIKWVETGVDPLCSYATGLLGIAMQIQEIQVQFSEKCASLVPVLIDRLAKAHVEYFAIGDAEKEPSLYPLDQENNRKRMSEPIQDGPPPKIMRIKSPKNVLVDGETSNSSWMEMQPLMFMSYQIHPLNVETKQIFLLRFLTPLCDSPDFLSTVLKQNLTQLVLKYVDVSANKNGRLAFEACRNLSAQMCHKKVATDFLQMDGLQKLLNVPRPSVVATGVGYCLYYLASSADAVEKICQLPEEIIERLFRYGLWLLECSHDSARAHATLFFTYLFRYRILLAMFDRLGGLRHLYNIIATQKILDADPPGDQNLSDDDEAEARQAVRHVCNALAKYFEAHLLQLAEDVADMSMSVQQPWGYGASPASSIGGTSRSISALRIPDLSGDRLTLILELASARRSWVPVTRFSKLGGIGLLLRAIGMCLGWSMNGRAEALKNALDVLSICAIAPAVQESFRSEVALMDDQGRHMAAGISIILTACQPDKCSDPEVQKAALQVLIPCICVTPTNKAVVGPVTPGDARQRNRTHKFEDSLSRRMRECVRANNGILILYQLMRTGSPITDADELRALACQALAGLARSESVRQVVGKHSLLSELQSYLREPILPEKKREHLRFSRHFIELLELVSGGVMGDGEFAGKEYDMSMEALHRMDVVARTKIKYKKSQVLALIHQHLMLEGLTESAAALIKEANFAPIPVATPAPLPPPVTPVRSIGTSRQLTYSSSFHAGTPLVNGYGPPATPMRLTLQPSRQNSPAAAVAKSLLYGAFGSLHFFVVKKASELNGEAAGLMMPALKYLSTSALNRIVILADCWKEQVAGKFGWFPEDCFVKVGSPPDVLFAAGLAVVCLWSQKFSASSTALSQDRFWSSDHCSWSLSCSLSDTMASNWSISIFCWMSAAEAGLLWVEPRNRSKALHRSATSESTARPSKSSQTKKTVTLDKLVTDYLANQHARCKNPMITCPEFDLFQPHKCPDRRGTTQASWNLSARIANRGIFPKYGGKDGAALTCRLLWSRFQPITHPTIRARDMVDELCSFSTCCFSPDDQFIMAGDDLGNLRLFNIITGAEEGTYSCHDAPLTNLQPYKDRSLLLTSTNQDAGAGPKSCLWSMGEYFDMKTVFLNDSHVEWGKGREQDLIIGTMGATAHIYDATTGQLTTTLTPPEGYHNSYTQNRATFSPCDELVLSDGVLWDFRGGKPVHKFDKFNLALNGLFHPNGLHILSNTEVWDIRTFHLFRQVPGLKCRDVRFNNSGDVFFGIPFFSSPMESRDDAVFTASQTNFRTFYSHDFSSIGTFEMRRDILDLAVDRRDQELVTVECSSEDSFIRRYTVGRRGKDSDDECEGEGDEEPGPDDDGGEGGDDDDDEDDDESAGERLNLQRIMNMFANPRDARSDSSSTYDDRMSRRSDWATVRDGVDGSDSEFTTVSTSTSSSASSLSGDADVIELNDFEFVDTDGVVREPLNGDGSDTGQSRSGRDSPWPGLAAALERDRDDRRRQVARRSAHPARRFQYGNRRGWRRRHAGRIAISRDSNMTLSDSREAKRAKHLVVDTGAFLQPCRLDDFGETIYTVRAVVDEIRDKAARQRLALLPFELVYKEPEPESILFVTEFSKKTGDYPALSSTDIRVIALTHTLQKQFVGLDQLRTEPVKSVKVVKKQSNPVPISELPGFYFPKKHPPKRKHLSSESRSQSSASHVADSESNTPEEHLSTVVESEKESAEPVHQEGEIIAEAKEVNPEEKEKDEPRQDDEQIEHEYELAEESSEDEDDEEEDDGGGWITPSNIKSFRENQPQAPQFSLPMPKGGKHSHNPLIAEGQRFPQQRPSRKSLQKMN